MFFTREDIEKIHQGLLRLGIKDSELPETINVNSDDTLAIVQDGKNKKINIEEFFNNISLFKKEGFINITDRFNKHSISLIEAIQTVPTHQRIDGLVITFEDINGDWRIYQFRGDAVGFFDENKWTDLYDYTNYIVKSITPDEEDLTVSKPDKNGNAIVSLKDRVYDESNFSGKGYKILRKNIQTIDGVRKNILTQNMINKPNTIYEIRYDFILNENITIPVNCILKFNGGSISGEYILTGNNTGIQAGLIKIFNTDTTLVGSWNVAEAYPEWFGAIGDGESDDTISIKNALVVSNNIVFTNTYGISSTIDIVNSCSLKGKGELKAISVINNIINIVSNSKNNIFSININGNDKADCGIYANVSTEGIFINDCELKNFKAQSGHQSEAIRISTNCSRIRINNVYIHDITPTFTGAVGNVDGSAQAILIGNVQDCIISNCTINNLYGNRDSDCIQIGIISLGNGNEYIVRESEVTIENCKILSITHRGVKAQCKGIIVRNCYFESDFINDTPDDLGRKYPHSAVSLLGSEHTIIENNIVNFKRTERIFTFSGNNIEIRNNTCNCNASSDYVVNNTGALDFYYIHLGEELIRNINIHDNIINGYFYSIVRTENTDGLYIRNNNFGKSTIQNISNTNYIKNLYIENNILETASGGAIAIKSVDWCYIKNNIFIIPSATYAISDRAESPKLVVRGNYLIGTVNTNVLTSNATNKSNLVVYYDEFRDNGIPTRVGPTSNRPTPIQAGGSLRNTDKGISYYDTDLHKLLFFKNITYSDFSGYVAIWIEADGTKEGTPRSGTFANKPTVTKNFISVGFKYFCTDKQTIEGATNGIMIYHKGNDVWVDALGRVVV